MLGYLDQFSRLLIKSSIFQGFGLGAAAILAITTDLHAKYVETKCDNYAIDFNVGTTCLAIICHKSDKKTVKCNGR
jgi:hypothetical protein